MSKYLNADQAAALDDLLSMPVTGQGGWQTRMRRFHTAFGSTPNEGVSNDQRLMNRASTTVARPAVAATRTAATVPQNIEGDPIAHLEALRGQLAETVANEIGKLTDQINRVKGNGSPVVNRKAVTVAAGISQDETPRKRRKSIKRSRAMKAIWQARKTAAAQPVATSRKAGKAGRKAGK